VAGLFFNNKLKKLMKKIVLLLQMLWTIQLVFSQNVGIGTTTPQTLLHVNSASGNTIIRAEATAGDGHSGLELRTIGGATDALSLQKWPLGSAGSLAGISQSGLSALTTGNTGPLLIGTTAAQSLNFATNNTVRMRIGLSGNVSIGEELPNLASLHVTSNSGVAINASTSFLPPPGNFTSAITGSLDKASLRGAGIVGKIISGSSSSGIIGSMYGVLGTAVDTGYAIGAFGSAGSGGLRSFIISGSGKAIASFGAIQLQGIGEGNGKVLTSDADGNATWVSLQNSHNHYGEAWSGTSADNGLAISNFSTSANATGINVFTTSNSGTTISGISSGDNGIGIRGYVSHAGAAFPPTEVNTAVAAINSTGNGLFASAMGGLAIKAIKYNFTDVNGNVVRFINNKTNNTAAVLLIENTATNPTALELNNGYIKVSGTNKMAFNHLTATGNINGNTSLLSYANQSSTDMVFVTHNYSPNNTYFNYNYGVYWTGSVWTIYIEKDSALSPTISMPVNINFNVMVIKQ
jgi:hypothetical protein